MQRRKQSPHTSERREAQAPPEGVYGLTKEHKVRGSNSGNGISPSFGALKSRPRCVLRAVRESLFQAIPAAGGCRPPLMFLGFALISASIFAWCSPCVCGQIPLFTNKDTSHIGLRVSTLQDDLIETELITSAKAISK